jgi:hypothetical protein
MRGNLSSMQRGATADSTLTSASVIRSRTEFGLGIRTFHWGIPNVVDAYPTPSGVQHSGSVHSTLRRHGETSWTHPRFGWSQNDPPVSLCSKFAEVFRLRDDAYARIGVDGSDVEIIENHAGFMECAGCTLENGFFAAWDIDGMVAHVQAHKLAGHEVPAYVIPRLRGRL